MSQISLEETSHYQITRGILQHPAAYWKHLQPVDESKESKADGRRKKRRKKG